MQADLASTFGCHANIDNLAVQLSDPERFVVVDDISPDDAEFLGRLARRSRSHILVTSRLDHDFGDIAPPIGRTVLGPLSEPCARELIQSLVDLSGQSADEIEHQACHGRPWALHRAAEGRYGELRDPLLELVTRYSDSQRRALTQCYLAGGLLTETDDREAMLELSKSFAVFFEGDSWKLAGPVSELIPLLIEPASLDECARELSARVTSSWGARRPPKQSVALVVRLLLRSGGTKEAWALLEKQGCGASQVMDYLLVSELSQLTTEEPRAKRGQTALGLLRRGHVGSAAELVVGIESPSAEHQLAAAVALARQGQAKAAQLALDRAETVVTSNAERDSLRSVRAGLLALQGAGQDARESLSRLSGSRADVPILLCQEDYIGASRLLGTDPGQGSTDTLFAILAYLESGACDRAAALVRSLSRSPLSEFTPLAEGALAFTLGNLQAALPKLRMARERADRLVDVLHGAFACEYLGRTLCALGHFSEALRGYELIQLQLETARFRVLAERIASFRLETLLHAGRVDEARTVALGILDRGIAGLETLARARSFLALARSILGDEEAQLHSFKESDLVAGQVALIGGDADAAIRIASNAIGLYESSSRNWLIAESLALFAAGHIERGLESDSITAERALDRAGELLAPHGVTPLSLRCGLYRAALCARRGDSETCRSMLKAELRRAPERLGESFDIRALRFALDKERSSGGLPGLRVLLESIGIGVGPRFRIVGAGGTKIGGARDVAKAIGDCDLLVDLSKDLIHARHGADTAKGRPTACLVLATLIEAGGNAVSPEDLFKALRGGEYHPLDHRNTLYVTVNRVRRVLRQLFPDRDIVKTTSAGWRVDSSLVVRVVQAMDES